MIDHLIILQCPGLTCLSNTACPLCGAVLSDVLWQDGVTFTMAKTRGDQPAAAASPSPGSLSGQANGGESYASVDESTPLKEEGESGAAGEGASGGGGKEDSSEEEDIVE